MADRPILFSAPMVRALLDGRKTQTRRIIKPRGKHPSLFNDGWTDSYILDPGNEEWRQKDIPIKLGDRLWVKETHAIVPRTAYRMSEGVQQTFRPNDDHDAAVYREGWERSQPGRWRPSIHMPRWASRLTLTVTEVRVERLQDINEADAKAEGVSDEFTDYELYGQSQPYRFGYSALWNEINGPGAWDENPWVVAYTFTVEHGNIDQIGRAA